MATRKRRPAPASTSKTTTDTTAAPAPEASTPEPIPAAEQAPSEDTPVADAPAEDAVPAGGAEPQTDATAETAPSDTAESEIASGDVDPAANNEPTSDEAEAPAADAETSSDETDTSESNEEESQGEAEPEAELVVEAAPAPASDNPTVRHVTTLLERYVTLMSGKIVSPAARKEGAVALKSVTELVITDPSDEVLKVLRAFHEEHKADLMMERFALRGTEFLPKEWAGRVNFLYNVMRCLVTGRPVNLNEEAFIKQLSYSARAKPIDILTWVKKKAAGNNR